MSFEDSTNEELIEPRVHAAKFAAVQVVVSVRDGYDAPAATPYPDAQSRLERYAKRLGQG